MLRVQVIPDYSLLYTEYPDTMDSEDGEQFFMESADPEGAMRVIVDVSDEAEKCAYLILHLFNDGYDEESVLSLADSINADLLDAMYSVINCRDYTRPKPGITWSGYIETMHVFPKFRKKGIASFILSCLKEIVCKGTGGISLGCLAVGEASFGKQGYGDTAPDISGFCEKNGFRKCRDAGHWIKDYSTGLSLVK